MRLYLLILALLFLASPLLAQIDWQSAYKVGDPIELFVADGLWQKGVVVENIPGQSMRVNCEDLVIGTYKRYGGVYIVYGKSDVRPAGQKSVPAVATPPPTQPTAATTPAQPPPVPSKPEAGGCLDSHPPGQVTRGAAPSEALFKRLIFEEYKSTQNGRKTGIVFHSFSLAEQYVNSLTDGVPRHMTASVGATVYRVKADHDVCVQFTDAIQRTKIKGGYFLISKDKSGDWFAAPDGKVSWDIDHLPNP